MMDAGEVRKRFEGVRSINVGGPPIDSQASLAIYSDDIDPDAVTAIVGCSPTSALRKGERDPNRPKLPPAPIGQWLLEAPEQLPFVDKLTFLLSSTAERCDEWQALAATHRIEIRAAIFLRSWTEGFEIDAETLSAMARRRWSFGLSMYSAEGNEIVDAFVARAVCEDEPDR